MKTITYDETQWKLVPVEPTREMVLAGKHTIKGADTTFEGILAASSYASMLAAAPTPPADGQAQHADDIAVDAFAKAMKAKMAKKRDEGRDGWQDKAQCSAEWLSELLRGHIGKGDPVDVANLAMMLHQRGESITCGNVASEAQQDADKSGKFDPTKNSPLTALQMAAVIAMRDADKVDAQPVAEIGEDENGELAIFTPGFNVVMARFSRGGDSGFEDGDKLFKVPQPAPAMAGDADLLDMLETLCIGLEWNIENHPEVMNESDAEALAQARSLLKRVQPTMQQGVSHV